MPDRPIRQDEIRRRAEDMLIQRGAATGKAPATARDELIHELEVRQIELEMQNEELQRAQIELENSRAKYFSLFDLAPIGYFTISEKGMVLEANLTGAALLGVKRRDLIRQAFSVHVTKGSLQQFYSYWKQVFESRATESCELRLRKGDGSEFYAHLISDAGEDSDGDCNSCRMAVTDISERKRMEQALRESEKLAATGRMAVRIAHEINNPLAGIKNAFLLVKDLVDREHPHYTYVELILGEIDRVASIIRKMFDLYGPEKKLRRLPVDGILRDVVSLLAGTARVRGVAIEAECPESTVVAMLPVGHVNQVLFNVISNAVEASEPGGVVTVTLAEDRGAVVIRVCDEGPGIQPEISEHMFEPFFTTKGSEGTTGLGLGLAVSESMVQGMGGSITHTGNFPKGTVFTITLPSEVKSGNREGL
jgi:PAS domain S-box-containing protein